MPELPLQGVRVVDLATLIAGPTAARMLADFGADVVKVERPDGHGDPIRAFSFRKGGVSLWWKVIARNKRPVTIDLKREGGRDVLLRLVERADVLVENFRPGTLERLGLGPDVLHDRNPRLVILRVSGWGQSGPRRDQPGFGTLAEAFSGYAELTGFADRPPVLPPIALADEVTGLYGAFATMVALYHRDNHGAPGQVIDAALYESLFALLGPLPTLYQQTGEMQPRAGSRIGYTAPRNAYLTADGHHVAVSGSAQTTTERIFKAIERPELFHDERFSTNVARMQNLAELDEVISEWIGRHPLEEVLERFAACEATIAPVHDMEGVFADPHYTERGTITMVPDAELGDIAMQDVFPRLSLTPGKVRHAGRPIGDATEEVLGELGYRDEERARLREEWCGMTRIAVTGVSGYVGRTFLGLLERNPEVTRIVGIDTTEVPIRTPKLEFHTFDVRDPRLTDLIGEVDILVHLAFLVDPMRNRRLMRDVNVGGFTNVLAAAEDVGVRRFVYPSSGYAYGAHVDNPAVLRESDPLRANAFFPYGEDKAETEALLARWAEGRDTEITILRPAVTIGPHSDNFMSRAFESPRHLSVRHQRPPLQVLHEDDFVAALAHFALVAAPGTYNLAADGALDHDDLLAVLGVPELALPRDLVLIGADLGWRSGILDTPPGLANYLLYPSVMATDAARDAGWVPKWSNRETVLTTVEAHRDHVSLGPVRMTRTEFRTRLLQAGAAGAALTAAAGVASVAAARRFRAGAR